MKSCTRVSVIVLVAAALTGLTTVSYALPVVVNPSFEADGEFYTGGWDSPPTPITGWDWSWVGAFEGGVGPAGFSGINNGLIPAGLQAAEFSPYSDYPCISSLSQVISGFSGGSTYDVSFFVNARAAQGYESPMMEVFIDDVSVLANQQIDPVEAVGSYTLPYHSKSFQFTATAASHELKYTVDLGVSTPGAMLLLDHVTIIPEPGTLALAALGLLGLAFVAWRKRRR